MTKAELVAKLAEAGGVSRKQADDLLSALIDNVVKTVKKGESLKIPARKKVGFTVAKTFKEAVLGKK